MNTVDVRDLPEPVAQAIQSMVDALRAQLPNPNVAPAQKLSSNLPVWSGSPIGSLTREEIYDDAA